MKLCEIICSAAVVVGLTTAGAYLNSQDEQVSHNIKTGKVELFCNFNGDYRKVPASKFKEFREVNGKWIYYFTNGSATNCYTEEVNNEY